MSFDYKSKRWLHFREMILRRDKFRCRESARYSPIPVEATIVHHVYPVDDFPGWAWERWNCIAVSQAAHNSFHDRQTGRLTEAGLRWQRRVSPPPSAPPPF